MVHDFNPGISANGLWWLVQVPDDAVQVNGDTVTVDLKDVVLVDQFSFPGGAGGNLGKAGVPASVTFHETFVRTGAPRHVVPTSRDPISPFRWAGKMSMATNSGTLSVKYLDGSFSASGTFDSAGNFGELGFERNGSFLTDDDFEQGQGKSAGQGQSAAVQNASPILTAAGTAPLHNGAKLRGTIPLETLLH